MRSILWFLWVPVLALGGGLIYGTADEPLAPAKGSVLILQNERTWEGDIVRNGKQYIVRRPNGGIMTFPKDEVLRLFENWDDLYVFMKSRIDQTDPDARKNLASYFLIKCDMPLFARIEINKALELRPDDAEAKQLKVVIEKAISHPRRNAQETLNGASGPLYEVGPETLSGFTVSVLPILLDKCALCHSGGRGGKFQLYRPHEGGPIASVNRSLDSVIAQLDLADPKHSRLLTKAVSRHGNQVQAPFKTKLDQAFVRLQEWTELLRMENPHLQGLNIVQAGGSGIGTSREPHNADRPGTGTAPLDFGHSSLPEDVSRNPKQAPFSKTASLPSPRTSTVPLKGDRPRPPWDESTPLEGAGAVKGSRPAPVIPRTTELPATPIIVTPPSGEKAPLPPAVSTPEPQPSSKQGATWNLGTQAPVQQAVFTTDAPKHTTMKITPPGTIAGLSSSSDRHPAFPNEASAPMRLPDSVQTQAHSLPSAFGPSSLAPMRTIPLVAPSEPAATQPAPSGDAWAPDIFNNSPIVPGGK